MRAQNISEILYRHDPGNTCCNVNEDMEDEYDGLAAAIASVPVGASKNLRLARPC